jgi:hypothetical protein
MSDQGIFWVGVFTSLLLVGGLLFTFWEFHKMNKQLEKTSDSSQKASPEPK